MTQLIVALRRTEAQHLTGGIETFAQVVLKGIFTLPERLLRTLVVWQKRYEDRQRMADLDSHLLRDVGLDRAAIQAETSKPIWRA